jgi:carboxymethylenebutenolidase
MYPSTIKESLKMIRFLIALFLLAVPALAQDWARKDLEKSPRHLEWVDLKAGDRTIKCFVAYPEVKHKAQTVLVIHEIFGLTDWVRSLADQLAEAGYVAIVPDLLGDTSLLGGDDAARKAIGQLKPEAITADLKAAAAYGCKLPASNGQLSVIGFCWGGTQSFRFATNHSGLKQALVFYGSAPQDAESLARIGCPIYGFYAENDARINQTLEDTRAQMAGQKFHPEIYAGAGHGFMRAGQAPDASSANRQARLEAWKRIREILR